MRTPLSRPSTTGWGSLPLELRQQIWGHVAERWVPDLVLQRPPCLGPHARQKCAKYATVNRDWQQYFERLIYNTISIIDTEVLLFYNTIRSRPERLQSMVRLRYTVSLPVYTCQDSHIDESAETIKINNVAFTHSLLHLVRALALWQMPEPDGNDSIGISDSANGLQLELGARSLSDALHYFQDRRIWNPNVPAYDFVDHFDFMRKTRHWRDVPAHGLVQGIRLKPPPTSAIRRVFGGRMLELDPDGCAAALALHNAEIAEMADSLNDTQQARSGNTEFTEDTETARRYYLCSGLKVAPIVRKLAFGRNYYRFIHPNTLLHLLQRCFPRVEFLRLEPWRPVDEANLVALEQGFISLLTNMPPNMRTLFLYLETNPTTHPGPLTPLFAPTVADVYDFSNAVALLRRRPSARVGAFLAEHGRRAGLENIGVLGLAEAEDFLEKVVQPAPAATWPKLRTLILSSSKLAPTIRYADITSLLLLAARAALRMPRLYVFELSYAAQGHTCRFAVKWFKTYSTRSTPGQTRVLQYETVMSLHSSWNMWPVLTKEVRAAWADVVQRWTGSPDFRIVFNVMKQSDNSCIRTSLYSTSSMAAVFLLPQSRSHMWLDWLQL